MRGSAICIVKASKSSKLPVGTYAIGNVGWTELAIMPEKELEKVEIPRNGRVTDVLGVLGMTGRVEQDDVMLTKFQDSQD